MNHRSRNIFLVGVLLFSTFVCSFGQNENNVWYFGRFAGIDFNTSPPLPLVNSSMNTPAACASISDENGALLFYTNSATIWDKTHQPMFNGIGLAGNTVSTQVRIVGKPGSEHLFYIFTVDRLGWANGLQYSLVDITRNSGLGEVVTKNVSVYTPSAEKIAVIPHCNKVDRWIVSHGINSSTFYAHLLTSQSISDSPVLSETGMFHNDGQGAVGYMKASENGMKLALMNRVLDDFGRCEIFDFDASSGQVSNSILIDSLEYEVYGLEFSPDASKLYYAIGTENEAVLYQVDLEAGTNEEVVNSVQVLTSDISFTSQVSALQLGPDEKIYLAKRNNSYLGLIEFPNLAGPASGYIDDAIDLGGRNSKSGLPDRVVSQEHDPKIEVSVNCPQSPTTFSLIEEFDTEEAIWHFGDPDSGPGNTATGLIAEHIYETGGAYQIWVEVLHPCQPYILEKEIIIDDPQLIELPDEVVLCEGENLELDFTNFDAFFEWSTGSTSPFISISNEGIYSVTVTNDCQTSINSISVKVFKEQGFDPIAPICKGESAVIVPTTDPPATSVMWEDGSNSLQREVTSPGMYFYTAVLGECLIEGIIPVPEGDCSKACDITFVPNAFTPNYDGINDVLITYGCDVSEYQMKIFDRWGSLVFISSDLNFGWDGHLNGRLAPEGIYVWLLTYIDGDGDLRKKFGDVVVLR